MRILIATLLYTGIVVAEENVQEKTENSKRAHDLFKELFDE